jgi:hypothetical protein
MQKGRYFSKMVRGVKLLAIAAVCLWLAGCFLFYDGSMDGFTVDGIYDGGLPVHIETCRDAVVSRNLLYADGISYDFPDDPNAGSLEYYISPTCFPDDAPGGFSRFDFVSPALTTWDDVTGYRFAVMSLVRGVQVQPMLEVRRADGSSVFLRMVDDFDEPLFFAVPDDWAWHNFTFERPDTGLEETVIGLRVRVFIPNATIARLGRDAYFVLLDTVIPLRP